MRTLQADELGAPRPSGPHIVNMLPPVAKMPGDTHRDRVVRTSYQRFTRAQEEVENSINELLAE